MPSTGAGGIRLGGVVLALLLVGCPAAEEPTRPDEAIEEPDEATKEEEQVLEGTLGGDAQLEGGCAWLENDEGRFEVRYPDGYEVAFEPVRLVGPDGDTVAEEGDVVRVRGRIGGDVVTVCQVGTVFDAQEVLTAS